MRTLTLLALWQLRNSVRTGFNDPRKLVPLVILLLLLVAQAAGMALMAGYRSPFQTSVGAFLVQYHREVRSAAFLILALIAVGNVDYGFGSGFLTFSLADLDYLFPTPVHRKLVLAYRLASKTAITFGQAALLYWVFVWRPIAALATGAADPRAALAAFGALLFCVGGYANLALVLKLVFGFGRLAVVRRWIGVALVALGAALAVAYWERGLQGFSSLAQDRLAVVLFYPCTLAAGALAAPLRHGAGWTEAGWLLGFYLVTLGMVLARRENFYEAALEGSERAAQILVAMREADWTALVTLHRDPPAGGRQAEGEAPHPASLELPAFGRGAGALLWAHLSAGLRRPVTNLLLPIAGGAVLVLAAALTPPPRMIAIQVAALGGYVLFVCTVGGIAPFRQALQRQPLVRPLPLSEGQVVLADVLPRTLFVSLFAWSVGLSLLGSGVRLAQPVALGFLFCAPPALFCLHLLQYVLALLYPDTQDRLHLLLAGVLSLFFTSLALGAMVLLLFLLQLLHVPLWGTLLLFQLPCAVVGVVLAAAATALYHHFETR